MSLLGLPYLRTAVSCVLFRHRPAFLGPPLWPPVICGQLGPVTNVGTEIAISSSSIWLSGRLVCPGKAGEGVSF